MKHSPSTPHALHPLCTPSPRVRGARTDEKNPKSCDEVFERLVTEGTDPNELYDEVVSQVGGQSGATRVGWCEQVTCGDLW